MGEYSKWQGKSARFPARRLGHYRRLSLIRDTLKTANTTWSKLLDIGSANGHFSGDLIRERAEAVCLDVNLERLKDGKDRYPEMDFIYGDGQKLPFRNDSFNVVLITNALRFIPDPGQVLLESSKVLEAGGALIIIDHNKFSLDRLWARKPDVASFLSMKEFEQMLSKNNLKVERKKYIFLLPEHTPHRFLGILFRIAPLLSILRLDWIFPEIFVYAVKKDTKDTNI